MRPRGCVALVAGGLLLVSGCAGNAAPSSSTPVPTPTSTSTPRAAVARVSAHYVGWRLPEPSARQALVDLGSGKVLLAGGMLRGDSSTASVHRLDLSTGRSAPAPRLSVPVHDAAGGRYAGAPAVFGGGNATEQALVQALHGRAWRHVDAFPTTRSDLSTVTTPGGTVVLGGYDGSAVPRAVLTQTGRGHLRPTGRLARGVRYAATALLGGAVYVFGGEVSGAELGTVQRLDPRTGRTGIVARLPRPLGHAMAATVGDRVLLVGGETGPDSRTDRMWWFDPAGGRFTRAGRLPRPLSDAAVVASGTSVWLLGGEDPGVTDRVVRLDVRR